MFSNVLLAESAFHNPRLELQNEQLREKVRNVLAPLAITRDQIARAQSVFNREIEVGLASVKPEPSTCSMLMVNTFVPGFRALEDRTQLTGDFISLDIGSSNFRVLHTRLRPDQFHVQYFDIPAEFRKGDSHRLFTFIATKIEEFVTKLGLPAPEQGTCLPLGFTFSFPMVQQAIDVGLLTTWTKNFDLPDVVGKNVSERLQEALDSTGNAHRIKVVAIINDSTGTLVKGNFIDPDCAIGLILGTGSNACYLERISRITKWPKPSQVYANLDEVMVNMECGSFGDNGCIDFVRTDFDRAVDGDSLFPGSFTFEKYLGGQFLGEILRQVLLGLVRAGVLFGGSITDELLKKDTIKASDLSLIVSDTTDESVMNMVAVLGYPEQLVTRDDVALIVYVSRLISIRVATLLATVLSSLIIRMARPRTVVAVDGSVYKKHPHMHQLMTDLTEQLLFEQNIVAEDNRKPEPAERSFKVILVEDGSGMGGGLVAALSNKLNLAGN